MHRSHHVEDRRWPVVAADHRRGRKRPDYVEAFGATEAQALRDAAALLRGWKVEPIEE
ncbi:MAG: hypothetical protein M3301_02680 [Chloroflexota bacterium]|nr:hypothetical protein [Chloroflexota bacterium]